MGRALMWMGLMGLQHGRSARLIRSLDPFGGFMQEGHVQFAFLRVAQTCARD